MFLLEAAVVGVSLGCNVATRRTFFRPATEASLDDEASESHRRGRQIDPRDRLAPASGL